MTRRYVLGAAAAVLALVTAPGAGAAPERTLTLERGGSATFTGATETNANPYYFQQANQQPTSVGPFQVGRCSSAAHEQCDEILVKLVNPLTEAEIAAGRTSKYRSLSFTLQESPARVADFDVQVFKSDANGTAGEFWTGSSDGSQSGNFNVQTPGERLDVEVETTKSEPSRWMLIRVIRFLSPNASYTATVQF